jgi:hypothetical protein
MAWHTKVGLPFFLYTPYIGEHSTNHVSEFVCLCILHWHFMYNTPDSRMFQLCMHNKICTDCKWLHGSMTTCYLCSYLIRNIQNVVLFPISNFHDIWIIWPYSHNIKREYSYSLLTNSKKNQLNHTTHTINFIKKRMKKNYAVLHAWQQVRNS